MSRIKVQLASWDLLLSGARPVDLCRFVVPKEVQPLFLASWREREQDMQQQRGFLDFKLEQDGDKFVVSSR